MWSVESFWGPLFFAGTWVPATLILYLIGPDGYPGWRIHFGLSALSVPMWWWFELVNARIDNWEYLLSVEYGAVEYTLFASVAFSTVVPALHSAWRLFLRFDLTTSNVVQTRSCRFHLGELGIGVGSIALVFVLPDVFFPLVWVGPFLALDSIVALQGGSSLLSQVSRLDFHRVAFLSLAGLLCGFLWEFWNFWASPKWVYEVEYLDVLHVFEMPIAGYLGYIPFVWTVYQLVHIRPLADALVDLEVTRRESIVVAEQ